MAHVQEEILTADVKKKLSEIIDSHKHQEGCLIGVLHEVQEYLGYIPYEAQKFIAEGLGVPLSEIYGVISFYSRFSIKPTGKYKVSVCLGTACYVKGADKIISKVEQILGVKTGETSADGLYTVEATRCIGACGLAPVITVNGDVYGKLSEDEIQDILEKYKD